MWKPLKARQWYGSFKFVYEYKVCIWVVLCCLKFPQSQEQHLPLQHIPGSTVSWMFSCALDDKCRLSLAKASSRCSLTTSGAKRDEERKTVMH